MSVARNWRRQGIGTTILDHLCREAVRLGFRRLILETAAAWPGAIAFYQHVGFHIIHEHEGEFCRDVCFSLDLYAEFLDKLRLPCRDVKRGSC